MGGGDIVAVSSRLAELAKDVTAGLTDFEVMDITKLTYATWRRIKMGWVPSDAKLLQFAKGIDVDARPFLDAAREVRPSTEPEELLSFALKETPLPQSARFKIMSLFRELMEEHARLNKGAA